MPLDEPPLTPLASDLAEGIKAISANQSVRFKKYVRLVLPLDGYVFWVRDSLVSPSALLNAMSMNSVPFNKVQRITDEGTYLDVQGSLHYATDTRQEAEESYGLNSVVFTTMQPIEELNDIGPDVQWIAEIDDIRFSFSSRGNFYKNAAVNHYRGYAIYPDMAPQVIDKVGDFNPELIVSNSLPIWLSMFGYQSFYGIKKCPVRLYPSYLSPNNLLPPYGVVDIPPASTHALTMAPTLGPRMSHSQLVAERVKVTLWGTRNSTALDFLDFVLQYTLDNDTVLGLMNTPVVADEKRTQSELNTIAMKKSIEFEVNYNQATNRDIARQFIQSCVPTFNFSSAAA